MPPKGMGSWRSTAPWRRGDGEKVAKALDVDVGRRVPTELYGIRANSFERALLIGRLMRRTIWYTKPRAAPKKEPAAPRGPVFHWKREYQPTKEEREAFAGLFD